MKILVISPEAGEKPVASGLAEAVNGSIKAYLQTGAQVRSYSPCYSCKELAIDGYREVYQSQDILRSEAFSVISSAQSPYFYVRHDEYYHREGIYFTGDKIPFSDNHFRYSLLAVASLQHAFEDGFIPDVIHCHEWAGGLVGAYAKGIFAEAFGDVPVVLTIHNAEYDYHFFEHDLNPIGLDRGGFHIDGFEYWGKVSMLKVSILYADRVVFASDGYRRQVLEEDVASGIRGFLELHQYKMVSVQHGINYHEWALRTSKESCKKAMQKQLGLNIDSSFLIYCHLDKNTRRTAETLFTLWTDLIKLPVQIVVGVEANSLEREMLQVAISQHPDRLALIILEEADPLRDILEASDLLFLASTDEPSASIVLKALANGTLTLAGTDIGCASLLTSLENGGAQKGNSLLVENAYPDQMLRNIRIGVDLYQNHYSEWKQLVENALTFKYSWEQSAQEYVKIIPRS